MECISCHSKNITYYGKYKIYQKYKCRNCSIQFSERSLSFYCRHRFPDEVIRNSILLSMFASTRYVKFIVEETMNFIFSHVSVFNWSKKFAQLLSKLQRSRSFSNIWHVDEKFIRVRGSKGDFAYLWVVIDDKNNIIATHVSNNRDIISAKTVLQKAKQNAERPPDIIVTDGLQAYKRACMAVFGRKTKHAIRHFEAEGIMHKGRLYYLSNNRIESLNSKINLWYKKFKGFKSLASARLWTEMFSFFYNYMRPRVIEHKIISIHQILM